MDPTPAAVQKKKKKRKQKENIILAEGKKKTSLFNLMVSSRIHQDNNTKAAPEKHVLEWPNQSPGLNPTQKTSKDLQKIVDKRWI